MESGLKNEFFSTVYIKAPVPRITNHKSFIPTGLGA